MAFTYDLTTDRGKVRLLCGDTVSGTGPRPDKRNFTDAEVDHFLTVEDDRINGAAAMALETLAAEWTAFALSEREGETSFDAKTVAAEYRQQARLLRQRPGGQDASGAPGIGVVTRTDAWT